MYTFIGSSGFHYDDWKTAFYPQDLAKEEWLPYYAQHFNSVEINNSFYSLPESDKLEKWHEQTPRNFRFSMKGSRYVTHMKKLVNDADLRDGVKKFYDVVEVLKGKLGCVLWQLPGNQHRDDDKLDEFCDLLSSDFKNVIEFRHSSWFEDPVFEILSNHGVSYSMISTPDELSEQARATTDTAYVRFHGKEKWYNYDYDKNEIKNWQQKLQDISARRVYLYFNNDAQAAAVKNAQTMKEVMQDT